MPSRRGGCETIRSERGLLREAVSGALARNFEMTVNRRRGGDLLAPSAPDHDAWRDLRDLVGVTAGVVPGDTTLRWREGVAVRLDWADDRLWLLIEPRVVFDGQSEENRARAPILPGNALSGGTTAQLNALIGYWSAPAWPTLAKNCGRSTLAMGSMLCSASVSIRHIPAEDIGMSSEIAPHICLPEPRLVISIQIGRPTMTSIRCEGWPRFGPHSKGLVPDPIRVATIAPAAEAEQLYDFMRELSAAFQADRAEGLSARVARLPDKSSALT